MQNNAKSNPPKVSVIVPVYNAKDRICEHIEALLNQSYPKDLHEIIIVDNGSQDGTVEKIKKYPVKLIIADSKPSPYVARNAGIKEASGVIIALIDVNCLPTKDWLKNGIKCLESENADLVGGNVTFTFSPQKTISEIYDSIVHVRIEANIATKQAALGGNLFARKPVFESVGLFPEYLRSGGDVMWTKRATNAGFKLIYSAKAEVFYSARKLLPLLRKCYRVGKAEPFIWYEQKDNHIRIFLRTLRHLGPLRPNTLRNLINQRGTKDMCGKLFQIWLVAFLCKIPSTLGRMIGIIRIFYQHKKLSK